jgi:hypothetical protein
VSGAPRKISEIHTWFLEQKVVLKEMKFDAMVMIQEVSQAALAKFKTQDVCKCSQYGTISGLTA